MLFAGGMWMSKVAQPLYFANENALIAFGVGYAVMALVGGLSFAWGALADRIGGRKAVLVGTFVYAVGIAGRLWTDLGATIAFSALAGAGASLTLTGIRPWVRSQVRDAQISFVVAGRNLGNQIGVFIGTVGAALLFAGAASANGGQAATSRRRFGCSSPGETETARSRLQVPTDVPDRRSGEGWPSGWRSSERSRDSM